MLRLLARQFARPSGLLGRFWIGPWLDRISGAMNRLALEQLDLQASDRVLEIGFGGGGLLAGLLAGTSGAVTGADVSGAMIERSRRRFRDKADRLRLVQASAETLPLPDASVDKAVSVSSFYFWPEPEAAFAELARVVRAGGRLVLCFEPPEELRKWSGHRFGFRLLEVEDVRALMEGAGFGRTRVAWGRGRKPDRFCCLSGTRLGANG
jgi:ubiquinone/menaquinone biosynthesis C-methylase UbiE